MLTLSILFIALLVFIILMRFSKSKILRAMVFVVLNLFVVEIFCYSYFLKLVQSASCFHLIGNQLVLDTLIKLRLSYAIYFVQDRENFVYQVDQTLGYTIGKDKNSGLYQTNNQGLRADREYSLQPHAQKLRLAAFGDSFVWCDGENNKDTWPAILEKSVGNLEVLNFGVSGYGLGQSVLRYLKDGLKFQPDVIFFNYATTTPRDYLIPNEIVGFQNLRMANYYRVMFRIEDEVLKSDSLSPYHFFNDEFRKKYLFAPLHFDIENSWVSNSFFSKTNLGLFIKMKFIEKKYRHMPYPSAPADEDEKLNLALLRVLFETAQAQDSTLFFFYGVSFDSLPLSVQNLVNQYSSHIVYVYSKDALNETFEGHQTKHEDLLNSVLHYNAQGNQYYAEAVLKVLKNQTWEHRDRHFKYNPSSDQFQNSSLPH